MLHDQKVEEWNFKFGCAAVILTFSRHFFRSPFTISFTQLRHSWQHQQLAGACPPLTCLTTHVCHMSHASHVTCVTCHLAIDRRLTSLSELHFGRGRGCHAATRSSQVTTLLLALALLSRASIETLHCSGNLRIVTRFFRGSDGVQLAQSRVRVFYDE